MDNAAAVEGDRKVAGQEFKMNSLLVGHCCNTAGKLKKDGLLKRMARLSSVIQIMC